MMQHRPPTSQQVRFALLPIQVDKMSGHSKTTNDLVCNGSAAGQRRDCNREDLDWYATLLIRLYHTSCYGQQVAN